MPPKAHEEFRNSQGKLHTTVATKARGKHQEESNKEELNMIQKQNNVENRDSM